MKRLTYISTRKQTSVFSDKGLPRNFKAVNYNKIQNCVHQIKVVWYLDDDGSIYETTPHVGLTLYMPS
jgi:hypothetical protein